MKLPFFLRKISQNFLSDFVKYDMTKSIDIWIKQEYYTNMKRFIFER